MSKEKEVDARLLLPELKDLLSAGCRQVYTGMADVDRRLRGKGFPDKVALKSVNHEISGMDHFIGEHIQAELAMWKPEPRLELWYRRNKSWSWVVGTSVAVAGVIATIFN